MDTRPSLAEHVALRKRLDALERQFAGAVAQREPPIALALTRRMADILRVLRTSLAIFLVVDHGQQAAAQLYRLVPHAGGLVAESALADTAPALCDRCTHEEHRALCAHLHALMRRYDAAYRSVTARAVLRCCALLRELYAAARV